MSDSTIPPRPTKHDEDIIRAGIELCFFDIFDQVGGESGQQGELRDELFVVVKDAAGDLDGYNLARLLEDTFYWSPDAQLVDSLDGIADKIYRVHAVKVKEWVQAHNVTPLLKAGDRVEYKSGWEVRRGVIAGFRMETAEYLVHEDGKEYRGSTPESPLGTIVPYEAATKEACHAD